MRFELSSKAGKLPVQDRVREILVDQVLPILLEDKEQFYKGNGQNLTLGMDSFNVNLVEDDGSPAGRVMFSWSPNIWGPKVEGAKNGKGKAAEIEGYKLGAKDIAALDAAITQMKQAGDVDSAVKLATIKSTYDRSGTVTRDELKLIVNLQAE